MTAGDQGCSNLACKREPVHSVRFRHQYGHVHYCDPCLAYAREWYDVATAKLFPCTYANCSGPTWIDYPPELT